MAIYRLRALVVPETAGATESCRLQEEFVKKAGQIVRAVQRGDTIHVDNFDEDGEEMVASVDDHGKTGIVIVQTPADIMKLDP